MTSYVKYPQEWPHAHLSLHFINKTKKYDELSIQEFCAGYSTILEGLSGKKLIHRVEHLKELMYFSTIYRWDCVLSYHAACLLEIERGNLRWGDSFQKIQMTTLAGGTLNRQTENLNKNESGPVVFCRNFQQGFCAEATDHMGEFKGNIRLLRHICASCWLYHRKKSTHPESECPTKEE